MRIKLTGGDRHRLFSRLKIKYSGLDIVASKIGFSRRTLTDWKRGRFLMPGEVFEKLVEIAGLSGEIAPAEILPEFWNIKNAARKGAAARMKLYGNLGTSEGCRKGGLISMAKHRENNDWQFTNLKKIRNPEYSEKLAEFMGIMMGDGHLADYQATMSTNSETDVQHANFVAQAMQELFGISPMLNFKKDQRCVEVVASSKAMVEYIQKLGMPRGNKIEGGLEIPVWILNDQAYQKAFLRGLFDTDGSIFLDKHMIKGRIYRNIGWTITSYADTLRAEVYEILRNFGFSPTLTTPNLSVFMRRKNDIDRYFEEIGTHNNKHRDRYQSFINQTGGFA